MDRLQPAQRGARAASARAAPRPERNRAHWGLRHARRGACLVLEAGASTPSTVVHRKREASRCYSALCHRACTDSSQRACAASARAAPPPKRKRAQWRLRHARRGACLALEAAADTSEHGRAPKERGLSLMQCAAIEHGPNPTSAERRARAARSRAAPPPDSRERELAQ